MYFNPCQIQLKMDSTMQEFKYAIETTIVTKEEFCLKLLLPHDLVIDKENQVLSVFPSTNTNFIYYGIYTEYKVTCENCSNCNNCVNCKCCMNCNNCNHCNDCTYCFNCTDCKKCKYCDTCTANILTIFSRLASNNDNCSFIDNSDNNKYCEHMYQGYKNNTCSYLNKSDRNIQVNFSDSSSDNDHCYHLINSYENKLCSYLENSKNNKECKYGKTITQCSRSNFISRSDNSLQCNTCEAVFNCVNCNFSNNCVACKYSKYLDSCLLCEKDCKFLNACDNCICTNFSFNASYCNDCVHLNTCNLCKSCDSLSNCQLCMNTNFSNRLFVSKSVEFTDNSMIIQNSSMCNNMNNLDVLQTINGEFFTDKNALIKKIFLNSPNSRIKTYVDIINFYKPQWCFESKILKIPKSQLIKIPSKNYNIVYHIHEIIENIVLKQSLSIQLENFVFPKFIELLNMVKNCKLQNMCCKNCYHCNNLISCNNCDFVSFSIHSNKCEYCNGLDTSSDVKYTTLRFNSIQYIFNSEDPFTSVLQTTHVNQFNTSMINSIKSLKRVEIYDCECGCGRHIEVVKLCQQLQIYICYNEDNEVVYIGSNHVGIIFHNYFGSCEVNGNAMIYAVNFYEFIDPLLYLNHKNIFDNFKGHMLRKFDRNGKSIENTSS